MQIRLWNSGALGQAELHCIRLETIASDQKKAQLHSLTVVADGAQLLRRRTCFEMTQTT